LSVGRGFSRLTNKYKFAYLNHFRLGHFNNVPFYSSKLFADLTLESLLKDYQYLQGKVKDLKFYEHNESLNKDILDNPLKVLDFMKDLNNPEFKVHSDFIKFEGQYLDSSIVVEKPRGFKPNFSFVYKPKKPFSLVF